MKPPDPFEFVPDYAKRCADIVNSYVALMQWEVIRNSWVAIRLSDGGSDGILYDTKHDAVTHQLDEKQCAYISFRNCPGGITPLEAKRHMEFHRAAYDAGMRLPDPDLVNGGPDLIIPVTQYDWWCRKNGF